MLIDDLLALATDFAGRPAKPESRVYADLDSNGSDFIEFVEELERRYEADLSWVSPASDSSEAARDPTLEELALAIAQGRNR